MKQAAKNIFSKESFSDILKTDATKAIDNSFKNAEKKSGGFDNGGLVGLIKSNGIVLKIALKRFKDLTAGKDGNIPRKYVEELEGTGGVYAKRDNKIRYSVKTMYDLIKSSSAKAEKTKLNAVEGGVLKLYIRIYDVINDSKWSSAFSAACKFHKNGVDSGSVVFMNYVFMVYTLEFLTLALREYGDDIAQYKFDFVNTEISHKYVTFVKAAAENIVPVVVNCENTKNPKGYVDNTIKAEKNKNSTEEAGYKHPLNGGDNSSLEALNTVSQEDGLVAAVIYGVASIFVIMTVIHAIRYIIYSMSCLVVDISKSLQDQSYTLLVSIESLERKLASLKSGSKEYKDLEKIIEKQKYYTAVLTEVANKLSDSEMENIDEIRKKEYEDDETIKESSETSTSGTGDGGLDI